MTTYNNFEYEINNEEVEVTVKFGQNKITIPEYIENKPVTKLTMNDSISNLTLFHHIDIITNRNIVNNLYYYGDKEGYEKYRDIKNIKNIFSLFNTSDSKNSNTPSLEYVQNTLGEIYPGDKSSLTPYINPSVYELSKAISADLEKKLAAAGSIKSNNKLVCSIVTEKEMENIIIGYEPEYKEEKNYEFKGGYFNLTDFIIEVRIPRESIYELNYPCMNLKINNIDTFLAKLVSSDNNGYQASDNLANYIVIYGKLIGNKLILQTGGFSGRPDNSFNLEDYTKFSESFENPIRQFIFTLTDSTNTNKLNFPANTFIRIWGRQGMYQKA